MFSILSNSGKVHYGQKEFLLDFESDLSSLPGLEGAHPGSVAFVIEKSQHYMLNNYGQWVAVNLSSGGSSSGGGSDDEGGGSVPDGTEEINYDGGLV